MEMPYGESVTYEIHGLDIATRFTEIEEFSRDDDLSIRGSFLARSVGRIS